MTLQTFNKGSCSLTWVLEEKLKWDSKMEIFSLVPTHHIRHLLIPLTSSDLWLSSYSLPLKLQIYDKRFRLIRFFYSSINFEGDYWIYFNLAFQEYHQVILWLAEWINTSENKSENKFHNILRCVSKRTRLNFNERIILMKLSTD